MHLLCTRGISLRKMSQEDLSELSHPSPNELVRISYMTTTPSLWRSLPSENRSPERGINGAGKAIRSWKRRAGDPRREQRRQGAACEEKRWTCCGGFNENCSINRETAVLDSLGHRKGFSSSIRAGERRGGGNVQGERRAKAFEGSKPYRAIRAYLSVNSSRPGEALKAEDIKGLADLCVSSKQDYTEELPDEFRGIKLLVGFRYGMFHNRRTISFKWPGGDEAEEYFTLSSTKKYREVVTEDTLRPPAKYVDAMSFRASATFETLAMDPKKKQEITTHLLAFSKYQRLLRQRIGRRGRGYPPLRSSGDRKIFYGGSNG
nr:AAA-ATPase ASD, mitochondrial-like [Ipomoea batatas]